jgi:hypothetical protein
VADSVYFDVGAMIGPAMQIVAIDRSAGVITAFHGGIPEAYDSHQSLFAGLDIALADAIREDVKAEAEYKSRPVVCACGIDRRDCDYHKDA